GRVFASRQTRSPCVTPSARKPPAISRAAASQSFQVCVFQPSLVRWRIAGASPLSETRRRNTEMALPDACSMPALLFGRFVEVVKVEQLWDRDKAITCGRKIL